MNKYPMVPFSPFPYPVLKNLSSHFLGIGAMLTASFTGMELELQQSEMPFDRKEYGAMMFVVSGFYFIFVLIFMAMVAYKAAPQMLIFLPITFGAVAGFSVFLEMSMYPKMQVKKRTREVERNLVFALRVILIQLRSGVDLFTAMSTVANRDFGQLSKEFKKALDEISTGVLEEDALQKMATNNPSPYFRKALWQLVTGMKGGADVTGVIAEVVSSLTKEQQLQIKRYGASLSLLSLTYMMLGVIVPALGVTMMIILGTFPQIKFNEMIFWIFLISILVAEFMFIGMVKSKRPNLLGG
jgi:pilus assembly protein TadC